MNLNHIPKSELKDGEYYSGRCRNASIARWNAKRNVFLHWRTKFTFVFLEEIKCPEDDPMYDVFYAQRQLVPEELLNVKPIPLEEKP